MKDFESGHGKLSPNRFYLAIIFSNSALGLGGSGATAGRRYERTGKGLGLVGFQVFHRRRVKSSPSPKRTVRPSFSTTQNVLAIATFL